ncbi:MAG: hypothetical protein WCZ43_01930 [Proteiniphilum sp.]
MKRFTFLLILLSFSSNIFLQTKKCYDEKGVDRIKNDFNYLPNIRGDGDSLLINNNMYYFKESPIIYLDEAHYMIYDNIVVLPAIDPGYSLLWSIEEGRLFIKTIYIYRADYTTDIKPTKEESMEKMELFLGRNFEENRLFADFVTGKFVLYKYPFSLRAHGENSSKYSFEKQSSYNCELSRKQEVYIAEFSDGVLVKLDRNKTFERKLRKYLKGKLGSPIVLF